MPTISVIITAHKVADYLDRCLDSVLSQDCAGVEFIAVDDASPDDCGAILAARQDPRLRVIRTAAGAGAAAAVGPGGARALGAAQASGEYLWFVDGDDELAGGALAAVAAQLDRLHPDVLIIDYENIYADGTITASDANLATPELTTIAASPVLLNVTMSVWNKVLRRDFLAGLGVRFGPGRYEEVPVAAAALLAAARVGVLNQVCYRYRRSRTGSFMGTISDLQFDIFTSYQTIFDFMATRPVSAAARAALFTRAIKHYAWALPKVPRSRRREFFGAMTRDFRRWRPAEYDFPSGPRGTGLKLISRGSYRTYSALERLNQVRVALRRGQ